MAHHNAINRRGDVVEFSAEWFEDGELFDGSGAVWEILLLTGPRSNAQLDEELLTVQIVNKLPEEQVVAMARAVIALM